jgi:hypothetical protein
VNRDITLNDQEMIEEALKRMRSAQATIPEEKVRQFLTRIGVEIQSSGELHKEVVDRLLLQLQNGE